jgi:hypothetical protein
MPYSLEEIKQWIASVLKQLEKPDEAKPQRAKPQRAKPLPAQPQLAQPHLESLLAVLATVGSVLCLMQKPRSNAIDIKQMLGYPEGVAQKYANLHQLVKQSASHWKIDLIEVGKTKSNWKLRLDQTMLYDALSPLWQFLHAQPRPSHAGPVLIKMGCGPLLIPFFAPRVIAEYRRDHSTPAFEAKLVSKDPASLTTSVRKGDLDLIVTSFTGNYKEDERCDFFGEELEMHLCVARRSRIDFGSQGSLNLDQFKSLVAGKRVVMLDPNRSPRLCPENHVFPESTRHESVSTWMEVIGVGLAGNDTCCLAYPQIFPPEDRVRFRTIPLEGREFPTLRLGVARHMRSDELPMKKGVLKGLFDAFAVKIREAHNDKNAGFRANEFCPQLLRTAHVSHNAAGKAFWIHGLLRNRVITADGYLRADHEFEARVDAAPKTLSLAISGHLAVNSIGVHLTWRGYDDRVPWTESRESYVASFSAAMQDFQEQRFVVGLWTGRESWKNANAPDVGYFILYDQKLPLSNQELTKRLNAYLKSHRVQFAPEIPAAR